MNKETLTVTDNRTGRNYEFPIQNGTIRSTDLRQIKVSEDDFGLMGYDPAFMNTASCQSKITFVDGEKGILRYRGYPIEELAEKSTYLETAYLILYGELPTAAELKQWVHNITFHTILHENIKKTVGCLVIDGSISNIAVDRHAHEPTLRFGVQKYAFQVRSKILIKKHSAVSN